jgi:hypothetical protein
MRDLTMMLGLLWLVCGCGSFTISSSIPLPTGPGHPRAPRDSEGTSVIYHPRGVFPAGLHIPKGHLPPAGACRIWFPGRPPGQQPPPGDCSELAVRVPPGAWLLSRPARDRKHVHVRVYDQERPGIVIVIRVFEAATGRFVRDIDP